MSWTIERRGRVAVVTMTTNTANGGHEATRVHASPRLSADPAESPANSP